MEQMKINVKYYTDTEEVVMNKKDWDKILAILEVHYKKEEIIDGVKKEEK